MTNTGNISACLEKEKKKIHSFPLLFCWNHMGSNPEQPLSLSSSAASTDETSHATSSWRDYGRLGCLFTICIQSSFDTVPRSSFFPKPQRDSIFGLLRYTHTHTHSWNGYVLSDPACNNRFTLSQSCCLTYSIPEENSVQDICQSSAVDDVNGSLLLPDSSSTFNHSLWDYGNRILLYKLWPCVPLPQSLATYYSLSKQAIARER